jgi:group I intron endonuclease
MTGIYKIISPTGRIYVGQSVDIKTRLYKYKTTLCKEQPRLFNSVKKYGWDNHNFSVIELCTIDELNNRERYWQDFYNVIGDNGLNCVLTKSDTKTGYTSEQTKKNMSLAQSGRKHRQETILKFRKIRKENPLTKEHKDKLLLANKRKLKNICGNQYNNLTATNTFKRIKRQTLWLFKCVCGKEKLIDKSSVISGNIKSCGCGIKKIKAPNIKGNRYSYLVATGNFKIKSTQEKSRKRNTLLMEFKCDCGTVKFTPLKGVMKGTTKSCGCYRGNENKIPLKNSTPHPIKPIAVERLK